MATIRIAAERLALVAGATRGCGRAIAIELGSLTAAGGEGVATLGILRNGIEIHLIASHFAVPLMLEDRGGLVVEVGDGKGDVPYRGNLPYDLVKTAVVRMGEGLAHELRPHGITALTVTPGWLRSESMLDHFSVTKDTWREAAERLPYFSHSETPHLLGRGIAALAADPDRDRFAGQCLGSWDLMRVRRP